MKLNLTIAAKLGIAYALFLAPIGYLGYQTVADKEAGIGFAQKEIVGVRYISEIESPQMKRRLVWTSIRKRLRTLCGKPLRAAMCSKPVRSRPI